MFTTAELHPLHRKLAFLSVGTLRVPVSVLDTRQVFSRVDCLVTPVGGNGEQWVSVDRLSESQSNEITAAVVQRGRIPYAK